MDEVDGMSAGDRGGVGALNALIKKSKVCRYFIFPFTPNSLLDPHHLYRQRPGSSEAQATPFYYV